MTPRVVARTLCAAILAVLSLSSVPAHAASGAVPFTDPAADGYIGFCDLAGHDVTSGSVDSAPFVWKAVSSVEAPAAYRGEGQNTGLFIYQVRRGLAPGDWSGEELTSDSFYKHAKEPTAAATYKDYSLKVITTEYPPMWNGLYALRMQFGKEGYGVYSATYPMTVIQVRGATWHVVSGGVVNCAAATGESQESVSAGIPQLAPTAVRGETAPTAPATARATSAKGQHAAPNPAATAAGGGSSSGLAKAASQPYIAPVDLASHHSGGSSTPVITVAVVAGLVVLALGGAVIARRRPATKS